MLNTWFHEILQIKQELFVALLDIDEKCIPNIQQKHAFKFSTKLNKVLKLANQ